MKRILHLTLKKKWFDLIVSGKKKIEYRKYKPYWIKRLTGKEFTEIHFRNGYREDSPFMRVECLRKEMVTPDIYPPENGEELNGIYFALILGKVLEVRNGPVVQQ